MQTLGGNEHESSTYLLPSSGSGQAKKSPTTLGNICTRNRFSVTVRTTIARVTGTEGTTTIPDGQFALGDIGSHGRAGKTNARQDG